MCDIEPYYIFTTHQKAQSMFLLGKNNTVSLGATHLSHQIVQCIAMQPLHPTEELVLKLTTGERISQSLAKDAFLTTLTTKDPQLQQHNLALILSGMLIGNTDPQDIFGLFDAVFEHDDFDIRNMPRYHTDRKSSMTLAGSGKKGYKTVNLSSISAFVVSCFDIDIVKLAAPSTSSQSGSEDFISSIGANRAISTEESLQVLRDIGLTFIDVRTILPRFSAVYTGNF